MIGGWARMESMKALKELVGFVMRPLLGRGQTRIQTQGEEAGEVLVTSGLWSW
jgi:hypothetical protein